MQIEISLGNHATLCFLLVYLFDGTQKFCEEPALGCRNIFVPKGKLVYVFQYEGLQFDWFADCGCHLYDQGMKNLCWAVLVG